MSDLLELARFELDFLWLFWLVSLHLLDDVLIFVVVFVNIFLDYVLFGIVERLLSVCAVAVCLLPLLPTLLC